MANNRIHYPIQQVAFRKADSVAYRPAHGVQSVGTTTTFNLEQAYELGQLAIYENIEGIPDVEVTLSKVLDGYPLLFLLSTSADGAGADLSGPQLTQRALGETILQLGIWKESDESVGGAPEVYVEMSGLVPSSVSYNFPLEDNFTEDVTLIGNSKVWNTYSDGSCTVPWDNTIAATGFFPNNNDGPVGSGGVNARENMLFAFDAPSALNADYTRLPGDIFGVSSGGVKSGIAHVSSITVSTDLAREDLFELGAKSPYAKNVTFPTEVTCDIEVTSVSGDQVNAIDDCGNLTACATSSNTTDRIIRIATCEGTRIYLGEKNKLSSVSYGGGDAGGGNVSVTYSYSTFNDFTVLHSNDNDTEGLQASGAGWWAARSGYLGPAGTTQGI